MGSLAGVVTVEEAVMDVGNDVDRADGQSGHVLHFGNSLVGEVRLHTVDAGHAEAVGTVAVGISIGIGTIAVCAVSVAIGIAVSIANMTGHGAGGAAENNNDDLHHVWFG